jgi:hypothetical protein
MIKTKTRVIVNKLLIRTSGEVIMYDGIISDLNTIEREQYFVNEFGFKEKTVTVELIKIISTYVVLIHVEVCEEKTDFINYSYEIIIIKKDKKNNSVVYSEYGTDVSQQERWHYINTTSPQVHYHSLSLNILCTEQLRKLTEEKYK